MHFDITKYDTVYIGNHKEIFNLLNKKSLFLNNLNQYNEFTKEHKFDLLLIDLSFFTEDFLTQIFHFEQAHDFNFKKFFVVFNDYRFETCKIIEVKLDTLFENTIIFNKSLQWNSFSESLYKDSKRIKLTKNEALILKLLVKNKTLSYENIDDYLFSTYNFDKKRIQNIIYRLNSKLNYKLIEPIYGYGYKINY